MRICVLSGKGGTGKTTVSTNVAKLLGAAYVDADVEAPNGHLFLGQEDPIIEEVFVKKPRIDQDKCSMCMKCVSACEFNALAGILDKVMVFDDLCHSCGACQRICPQGVIYEEDVRVGVVERRGRKVISGRLDIGQPMAGAVISSTIEKAEREQMVVIDASPGTSCNVVKALQYADYAILVTEPSAFGLHDVGMAIDVVKSMNVPFGVVLNRAMGEYPPLHQLLVKKEAPLIGVIPYEQEAASLMASGKLLVDDNRYKSYFQMIIDQVEVKA